MEVAFTSIAVPAGSPSRVMRAFYEALKAVYGPSHQIQAHLPSSDGSTLLKYKEAILQNRSEHFEGLFSD